MTAVDRCGDATRTWVCEAVRIIEADANRSADTHLHAVPAAAGMERPTST